MRNQRLQEVVAQAIAGIPGAFEQLCDLKGRDILYVSYKLLQNTQDAEDIAQEILVYIHDHIEELRNAEAFNVWLYQVIRGKCMDKMKKQQQISRTLDKAIRNADENLDKLDFLPDHFKSEEEKRKALLSAVDELSIQKKMVIMMFYFEGMRYEEIARSMEINRKVVDNILARSKKIIIEHMRNESISNAEVTSGMLTLPMVLASMEWEADHVITAEMVRNVKLGVADRIRSGEHGSKAEAETRQGPKKTLHAVTGAAVTGVIAIAGLTAINQERQLLQQHNPSPVREEQQVTQMPTVSSGLEEDYDINTLEELIGAEEAGLLRGYSGAGNLDLGEVEAFLEQIGCKLEEGILDAALGKEYNMYVYSRKNKQLAVILKIDTATEMVEMVFCLMDVDEELPRSFDILDQYAEWK